LGNPENPLKSTAGKLKTDRVGTILKLKTMNKFKLFFPIFLVLTSIVIFSCEKDSTVGFEDQQEQADDVQSDNTRHVGGLIFMDEAEYQTLPMVDLQSLQNISGENDVESRSQYVKIYTPPVVSQGSEGSCTAFATSYTVSSYYTSAFRSLPYTNSQAIRSPEYVYNSSKIAGDCGRGAYLSDVLNFIRDKGVCSWSQMPYTDANGCNVKPNATQISQGVIGKIKSWNTVAKNVTSIKELLKKGYPVIMAFDANTNFDKETLKAPYIYKTYKQDTKYYGHAVTIVGYDDVKKHFIVQNSWGTWNHDKGFFYVTYNLFPTIARELYVMNPFFPENIKVRHASKVNEITIKMNNISYLIKKGQTVSIPAKFTPNQLDIWECIFQGQNQNCKWDNFAPAQGKSYKIIDVNTNYDLKLVLE
jgi:C1A family cysteine protease